jgi:hypothetical protein
MLFKGKECKVTIVSNFPFQNRATSGKTQHKVWINLTKQFSDLLNKGDEMLLVSPQSWGSPSNKVLNIFQQNTVKYINFDSGKYFPGVGSSFSDYHIVIGKDTKIRTKFTVNKEDYDLRFDDSVLYIPNDICKNSHSIHQKVIFSRKDKLVVNHDYVNCHNILLKKSDTLSKIKTPKHINPVFHTNRQVWYSSVKQDFFDKKKVIWTRSGYTKPFYDSGTIGGTDMAYYVLVDNEKDGKSLEKILNSELFQYIFRTAKWSGFGNEKVFSALPDVTGVHLQTDKEIYEYFGITDEEISHIRGSAAPKRARLKINKEVRTKDRIDKFGEVFTPSILVNEMLDRLDADRWIDSEQIYLDPTCGNGNFLVEVIKRKITAGMSVSRSIDTTYGIDIMPDNVEECRKRMVDVVYEACGKKRNDKITKWLENRLSKTIVLGDVLKFTPEDIFSLKPSKELKAFRENAISNP